MRITGGELRGRLLRVPDTGLRPTQERVREAIFSSLAAYIPGSRFLDLFAGSGAVGLEAWSRGATEVQWVEERRKTFRVLQKNVETLCGHDIARSACHSGDVFAFLGRAGRDREKPFDVVFADPPYAAKGELPWLEKTLHALQADPILNPRGVFVYEQSKKEPVCEMSGWDLWKDKTYGSTRVVMYRPIHQTHQEESA